MRLIFVRHADPDYSIDSLTEKGFREAKLLAKRVSRWKVDECYCSPLGRAKDTANISLKSLNKKPIILDWLKEFYVTVKDMDSGMDRIPWDFMPSQWTKEELLYDKDNWVNAPVMQTGDIDSSYQYVCNGIDTLLEEYGYIREGGYYITKEKNDTTIVLYCHLGLMFTVMSHLLGMSPSVLWQGFFVAASSVTVLSTEERIPGEAYFRCQVVGDTKHLHDGGEPISSAGYFADIFQE